MAAQSGESEIPRVAGRQFWRAADRQHSEICAQKALGILRGQSVNNTPKSQIRETAKFDGIAVKFGKQTAPSRAACKLCGHVHDQIRVERQHLWSDYQ